MAHAFFSAPLIGVVGEKNNSSYVFLQMADLSLGKNLQCIYLSMNVKKRKRIKF
jgi:hypothetical protein